MKLKLIPTILATVTLLILAQACAEASPPKIPCSDESDYPNLTGTGTQDDPYILSADKCLRIVNSHKDKPYYAKFSLSDNIPALSITAVTTDNKSCKDKDTKDCLNKNKHVSMSIKDSNGDTQQCDVDSWLANCFYSDFLSGIKKGDFLINLSSSDSELVDLSIQGKFDDKSNFSSEIN